MDKATLIQLFREALTSELALLLKAAQASFAAATDPDSKAENKYDTRSLEASYVARGQSIRVSELQDALAALSVISTTPAAPGQPIQLGNVVILDVGGARLAYLIAPTAGGTQIDAPQGEACIITPGSPLGKRLVGMSVGSSVSLPAGDAVVVSVL